MAGLGTSLQALLDKACCIAGGRAFSDLSFRPALELLVRSCDESAALNTRGRHVLDSIVVRHLANRLLVEAEVEERPEVASSAVGPALVVTGLPRTGTTLLHNLLALDPSYRVLRLWQALRPVPPGSALGAPEAEMVRQARIWLERLYRLVPDFRAIHAATPEGPEECDALLQNDFASQHFDDMFDARAYSGWLATAPLQREYRSYARQLNVLRPQDDARPWVLKSPSHLGHLDALLQACPGTTVVQCHRQPSAAVPSYASLVLCLRRAYSDEVSPAAVGQQALQRCEVAVSRALAVREQAPERFVDVDYGELVRQPVPSLVRLYEQLNRPLPHAVVAAAEAWLARHPQHEHGVHRYTAEDFGLDARSVEEVFGPYLERCADHLR